MVAFLVVISIKHKHYLFALLIALIAFYELSGPVIDGVFQDVDMPAMRLVSIYYSAESTAGFELAILVFMSMLAVGYYLSGFIPRSKNKYLKKANNINNLFTLIVVSFVFIAGIISIYTGAGSARLAVYMGDAVDVPRIYYYGLSMMVVCGVILLFYLQERKWLAGLILLIFMLPLIYEIFISGRRQSVAPLMIAAILVIIYKHDSSNKYLQLASIVALSLVVLGVQFIVRYEASYGVVVSGKGISSILAPQIGEFSAVGLTSLSSWNKYVIGDSAPTYGFHLIYHLLNSVPYLNVGDMLYPNYAHQLGSIYSELAPYGAFSVLADSILVFGIAGVAIIPLIIGTLTRMSHERLKACLENGLAPTFGSIYFVSLLSIIVLKYRSGIGDALQSIVSFTVLYIVMISVPVLLSVNKMYKKRHAS
jgi:oligosaccharide repeat unit polymerase